MADGPPPTLRAAVAADRVPVLTLASDPGLGGARARGQVVLVDKDPLGGEVAPLLAVRILPEGTVIELPFADAATKQAWHADPSLQPLFCVSADHVVRVARNVAGVLAYGHRQYDGPVGRDGVWLLGSLAYAFVDVGTESLKKALYVCSPVPRTHGAPRLSLLWRPLQQASDSDYCDTRASVQRLPKKVGPGQQELD